MISFFCSLDFTGFRLLYLFSRWNFYLSVLFAVFAYIIFTEAISANCEEVIDSITKRKSSWQRGIGSIYLIVILIYHLTLIIGIIFTSIQNDGTRYLFEIFPRVDPPGISDLFVNVWTLHPALSHRLLNNAAE